MIATVHAKKSMTLSGMRGAGISTKNLVCPTQKCSRVARLTEERGALLACAAKAEAEAERAAKAKAEAARAAAAEAESAAAAIPEPIRNATDALRGIGGSIASFFRGEGPKLNL